MVFAEHVGHLVVTSNIVAKDLMKEPGLERSLLGDGLANILSGFLVPHRILHMVKILVY